MMQEGPKSISPDELLIGDIVFFMNASKQAIHVAVYAGKRSNTHFITHSVSEPYKSVMTTRLKPDHYPYRVFRCKDFNLAIQVACRMMSWVKHGLDFSYDKSVNLYSNFQDAMPYCHPKDGGQKQLERAQKDFNIIFYRYIGMASHPKRPFMVSASQNEGARCSEAITMAYNIETLSCSDAVYSINKINSHWISDKTTVQPESIENKFKPHQNYWTYFRRANDPNEYQPYGTIPENGIKDGHYPCSLSAWNYVKYPSIEDFIEKYPFCLPLDSKIVSSWAMMLHMQQTPALWQDMGQVKVLDIKYPLEDLETDINKNKWKEYVIKLFQGREKFQCDFQDDLMLSMSNLQIFQYSPEKKKSDCNEKRPRSFSCDLNTHKHKAIETEVENPIFGVAQSAAFHRAYKYVSPKKVTSSSNVGLKIISDTPSCRRKLF